MTSQYRETLNRWAGQHLPDGAKVISVSINYDDGYDPTYGEHSPSLDVVVHWKSETDERQGYFEETILTSFGELLTELFAIEEV